MRVFSLFISLLMHTSIVLFAVASLPAFLERKDDFQMIPVDILELADETNVRAAAEKISEDQKPQEQKKQEPDYAKAPPPPPPTNKPVPEDAMPEPKKVEKPQAKPEPQNKFQPKSLPRRKPTPPQKSKSKDLDLNELEALLDKEPKDRPKQKVQPKDDALDSLDDFLAADQDERPRQAIGRGDGLTMSQIDALRSQMQKCWRPPTGAANPEELVVELKIFLAQDGSLMRAPQVVRSGTSSFSSNSFSEAAERAALAAVNKCAPYDFLPIDKYDRWKEVTITFDPASMIGY